MLLDASNNHSTTTENTVCSSHPLEKPSSRQDPQLQIVPWVPGQPNQGPLFQPLLVTYGPLQKPEDCLDTGLLILLLPSASRRTPEGGPQSLVCQLTMPANPDQSPLQFHPMTQIRDSGQYPTSAIGKQ